MAVKSSFLTAFRWMDASQSWISFPGTGTMGCSWWLKSCNKYEKQEAHRISSGLLLRMIPAN